MPDGSTGKHLSFWIDTTPRTDYPPLPGDLSVDVAVLGGGITGLTAAVLLKRLGKTVAVVEMNRIAEGVTGNTTAKVTSQHKLIYDTLIKEHGGEKARLYAESGDDIPRLRDEVEAARRVGLPASFVEDGPLPFPVAGAVRFEEQAQFHVREYLLPLAEEILGDGSHIFENTRALDVEEGLQCRVETDRGRVIARDVVVATHVPFLFEGQFWGKSYPQREYGVAARIGETIASEGMFINAGSPTRSVRTASPLLETDLRTGVTFDLKELAGISDELQGGEQVREVVDAALKEPG